VETHTVAPETLIEQASALHARILTFDSHIDIPEAFGGPDMPADVDGESQFDLVKARAGQLSGAALVVHAPAARLTPEAMAAGRLQQEASFGRIMSLAKDHPDAVGIARSPTEFRKLASENRFAVVIGFQNAAPLEDDLSQLAVWADRGVRIFAFSFIGHNSWADSARPYPFISGPTFSNGLSALGREAVGRLNDLGVIVDVSQMSSAALADVLAVTRAPIVASHTAVRGLVDVDRNASDAELEAIKRNGGVVQIVGFGLYIRPLEPELRARLGDLWEAYELARPDNDAELVSVNDPATAAWSDETFWRFLHEFHVELDLPNPVATVSNYVDAIDYAVARIGVDHVGISSDFNHAGGLTGWAHVGQNLNVTAELIARGYGEADIAKLWGGNFFRVWDEILAKA